MTNPQPKIVIVENQAKQKILLDLLSKQPSLGDTYFLSLNVFLNTLVESDRDADWFRCAMKLEELSSSPEIKILKSVLRFPISIDQVLSFINEMGEQGWTLNDLPNQSDKDKDLRYVLNELEPLFNATSRQWQALESLSDVSHILLHDHFTSYPIQRRLERLIQKGLTLLPSEKKLEQVFLRYTNNPRSEAQAAVQMMLQDPMEYESQAIVCLDPNLEDQVESFLIEYDIPYFRVNSQKTHPSLRLIQDLIQLKLEPTTEKFRNFILNDILELKHKLSLITYLDTFKPSVDECLSPLTHVSYAFENEVLGKIFRKSDFLKLENEVEIALSQIRDQLNSFLNVTTSSFAEALNQIFDLYVSLHHEPSDDSLDAIRKVKGLFEAGYESLAEMKEPFPALLYKLSKLTIRTKTQTGVVLTDLKHAHIPGLKRVFLLSASQANYPQFESHKGLFDDNYYLSIPAYDLQAHYDHHMLKLQEIRESAQEVIYSFAIGSYDGKAQKLPYELESYFEQLNVKGKPWDLVEKEKSERFRQPSLTPVIADALFFQERPLQGSISAFEVYFKCPYQYYLHKGLGLNGPARYEIGSNEAGNILHAIMDHGIKQYGKRYATAMPEKLDTLIAPYILALDKLYRDQDAKLDILAKRLKTSLEASLLFMAQREHTTAFEPYQSEMPFNEIKDLGEGQSIHIRGTVDRIDTYQDGFLILDYKSSSKSLSESLVLAGAQLQLPTYAWIMQDKLEQKLQGAYYFSLKRKLVTLKPDEQEEPLAPVLATRKLKGWIFTENPEIDADGRHTNTVNLGMNGYSFPRVYDPELLFTELKKLYRQMIQDMETGIIRKQNKDRSCEFCDFRSFCQYKGPQVVMGRTKKDDSILLKRSDL